MHMLFNHHLEEITSHDQMDKSKSTTAATVLYDFGDCACRVTTVVALMIPTFKIVSRNNKLGSHQAIRCGEKRL